MVRQQPNIHNDSLKKNCIARKLLFTFLLFCMTSGLFYSWVQSFLSSSTLGGQTQRGGSEGGSMGTYWSAGTCSSSGRRSHSKRSDRWSGINLAMAPSPAADNLHPRWRVDERHSHVTLAAGSFSTRSGSLSNWGRNQNLQLVNSSVDAADRKADRNMSSIQDGIMYRTYCPKNMLYECVSKLIEELFQMWHHYTLFPNLIQFLRFGMIENSRVFFILVYHFDTSYKEVTTDNYSFLIYHIKKNFTVVELQ